MGGVVPEREELDRLFTHQPSSHPDLYDDVYTLDADPRFYVQVCATDRRFWVNQWNADGTRIATIGELPSLEKALAFAVSAAADVQSPTRFSLKEGNQ